MWKLARRRTADHRGLRYLNDLSDVKLVWLDSGHFVLDENAAQVACEIKARFAPELKAVNAA